MMLSRFFVPYHQTGRVAGSATAISGFRSIVAGVVAFAKNGSIPTYGDGTYGGAADARRCIFHAYEIGEG